MSPTSVDMRLVAMLASYWNDHPSAFDTSEGIREWWLGTGFQASLASVHAALEWLIDQGLIKAISATDGRIRYRRCDGIDAASLDELDRKMSRKGNGGNGED